MTEVPNDRSPRSHCERYAIVAGLERLIGLIRLLTPAGEISLTTASTLARLANAGPHRLSDLARAKA